MNKETIAFRKGMICPPNDYQNNLVAALDAHSAIMNYGFQLTEEAFINLAKADEAYIVEWVAKIISLLEESIGNRKAKPLNHKNQDTYKTAKEVYNTYNEALMFRYPEYKKYNYIKYADETGFREIFHDLAIINTAVTPVDYEIMKWFAETYGNDVLMPKTVPFKETLCMLAVFGLNVPVKTSTDVLRIAFYMSTCKSDLILEDREIRVSSWGRAVKDNPNRYKTFFKKFSNPERRYLLSLLEKVANKREMVLKREMWLRLGEIIHPGDYKDLFPKSLKAFTAIRRSRVKSWYGLVDKAFEKSFEKGLEVLSERPGEFARNIDALLRNNPLYDTDILTKFIEIGDKVSSKVLWELYFHFKNRNKKNVQRSVWIKGDRKPTPLPTLDPMSDELISAIQESILAIFLNKWQTLDELGIVYIDERLKNVPLPSNMRSLNESIVQVTRGTRMPFKSGNKNFVRPYIHWTAGVDIDLSVNFYNGPVCSFGNPSPGYSIIHSGDVIPRHKGDWAEYVSIPYNTNFKYALVSIRNFNGGSLSGLECIAGITEVDTAREKFDFSNVTTSVKLASKGSNINLFIIDFETSEFIVMDEDADGIPVEFKNNLNKYILGLSEGVSFSAYDLLKLHVESRGQLTTEIEKAEKTFMFEDFATSYEQLAKYML